MGTGLSKSPLERRNTVLRRSQRKSIHSVRPRVDNIYKQIKKFRGITTDDQHYQAIKNEIEYLKNDLAKKGRELQPQVRTIFENVYKRTIEAEDTLDDKLKANQEKSTKDVSKLPSQNNNDNAENTSEVTQNLNEVDTHNEETHDENGLEEQQLSQSKDKRKTVELKFLQVIPDEVAEPPQSIKPIKSPEDKRKSILKMGIAVMPGAMMNEIVRESARVSKVHSQVHYQEHQENFRNGTENSLESINLIICRLQDIEMGISEFVGRKHGIQYNKIRDELNKYLVELNSITSTDDEMIEQLKISKNYVGSCLNFLDERATSNDPRGLSNSVASLVDDVFLENNSNSTSKISPNILKSTQV